MKLEELKSGYQEWYKKRRPKASEIPLAVCLERSFQQSRSYLYNPKRLATCALSSALTNGKPRTKQAISSPKPTSSALIIKPVTKAVG